MQKKQRIFNGIQKTFFIILSLSLIFSWSNFVFAQKEVKVDFFYSEKCPHCQAEQKFLDEMAVKYPQIKISRYSVSDQNNVERLKNLCKECKADQYFGLVPMTFVDEEFILGFDNNESVGKKIEDKIREHLNLLPASSIDRINIPFLKNKDISKYSLPALSVILGILDGVNVCSFGAIILILGLVLAFKSKTKILITGGAYLLTTGILYGILTLVWYKVFSLFSPYLKVLQILIGILSLGAGIYFFKQFYKARKEGMVCEVKNNTLVTKFSQKVKNSFKNSKSFFAIIGSILLFAAILTIVEYPCSAVVPVIFAGILSAAHLSKISYLFYISLYIFFYLLDEIVIFVIAVLTMKLWITSYKITTWLNLVAAILCILLGVYYFFGFI